MRRSTLAPLDLTKFPLALASELRATFADVVSIPLPGRLATLVRRLNADRLEGEDPGHGGRATETSNSIGRRRRR